MQKVRAAQFFGLEAGYSPEELVSLSESAFSALRELHGNRLDIYRSVYFNAPNKIKPELEKAFPKETLQRIKALGGAGFTTDYGNLAGRYMHPSNHFMAQNFPQIGKDTNPIFLDKALVLRTYAIQGDPGLLYDLAADFGKGYQAEDKRASAARAFLGTTYATLFNTISY